MSHRSRTTAPALIAWIRLMKTHNAIIKETADIMRCHGLTVSRFDILNHVGIREGRTQNELADALFVTKGNVTQLLDSMEREGLLRRERDGRSKRVYLTDTGRALREKMLPLEERHINDALSGLSETELETLSRILRKLEQQRGR